MPVYDALISGVGGLVNAFGGSVLSQSYNEKNMRLQEEAQKRLMDYQWSNFGSPQAQVDAMAAAGLNPANLFGEGKSSFATPSGGMPSSAPIDVNGVVDVNGISNYIKSVADAKKAGMDTKLSEQEIRNKEVERQRNEFQFGLEKEFGKEKWQSDLAKAYMDLVLAADKADLNEIEKSLQEYKKQSEAALAQANEHQRDILKQKLENNPLAIDLENRIRKSEIERNQASAQASRAEAQHYGALAMTEDELRELRVTSQKLQNGITALEYEKDSKTLQDRINKIAEEVGVLHWSRLMSKLQYKDREAYTALQRLMFGHSIDGDVGILLKALKNYEELSVQHRQ